MGNPFHHRSDYFAQFLPAYCKLVSHYIPANGRRSPREKLSFHPFGTLKVQQKMLRYFVGHFVPGHGYHCIGGNAAVSGYRDIRRSGAYVHHGKVQHPKLFRDGQRNGRYGFQRKIYNLEAGPFHNRVEAFHHRPRQEGGYNLHAHFMAPVAFEAFYGHPVQVVVHDAVSHAVVLRIVLVCILYLLLRFLHRLKL